MNRLKRFVYTPGVLRVLRALKLTAILRNLHYRFATQPRGVYRAKIHGIEAAFRAANPAELVQVDFNLTLEEEVFQIILPSLGSGDVFVDVGANIGVFTILSALKVGETGQVIAFEPEACAYSQLEQNINLNHFKNVRAFQVALGEEKSSGKLYVERAAPSLMPSAAPPERGEKFEQIEIVNGDEFWKLHGLPIPRVVKIDVEGFEYAVLEGLRATLSNPATQLVVCEIHPYLLPKGTTAEMVHERLKTFGFNDLTEFPRHHEIQLIARRGA